MQSQLIVIVDDRVTNLKILDRLAASLGAATIVKTFTDPRSALASADEDCPDLVITDLKMPEIDGAEFIRRLHAMSGCADIPVIVVTAYEDRELRYAALDAGAADFLLSPIDHREFQARARNLLTLRRQQRALELRARSLEEQMIAEERRHQDAIGQSHARLLRVIDAIPAMISATDREGRCVFANRGFAEFVGIPANRLIGRDLIELRGNAFIDRWLERDARLFAGEPLPASFEEEILGENGEPRLLLTTKSALSDDLAGNAMVVTVSVDITQRKQAERDLIAAKELAEIANRSKTEFLANMSHELRTPLNAIIGFSQLMAGEMLGPIATPKYVGYARDILASAEHLLGIINDILDVSKLEAGKLDLVEEQVELPRMIRDLLRLVEQKQRGAEVRLSCIFAPDLPRLRADPRKVKQILLNLLTNAVKFSLPGGEVEIVAKPAGGAIAIAIVDHGIGMDRNEIEVAVSRFGQVASAWSRKHPGTGLGLPLAIRLTELHGGSLSIHSEKGVGTTVTVSFPRERSIPAAGESEARMIVAV